jgi:1-deoxy-D-xylulose-5-phosphate reductoisomerase
MKGVTILGSTGSVGTTTLDVLNRYRDRFQVIALTAHSDVERLFLQCLDHHPRYAVMVEELPAQELRERFNRLGYDIQVLVGGKALEEVAKLPENDCVMAAIVGAAGLLPTLAAVSTGKRVLLANKESLVMAGQIFMHAVQESGAELIPVDSEHNAIFQCMPPQKRDVVRRILLTASGGPFRGWSLEKLRNVTPSQACAHPKWSMGRKISVDSATLMNKGLEVIEARWLFEIEPECIEVLVHSQSIVHSLVEYADGSVLAQLSNPDMRIPIACGLSWPERISVGVQTLDLAALGHLDFEPPDIATFPCLGLARQAARTGGSAPVILNAANEIAVQAFLDGQLPFTAIPKVVQQTLEQLASSNPNSIEAILDCDWHARIIARTATARAAA